MAYYIIMMAWHHNMAWHGMACMVGHAGSILAAAAWWCI